MDTDTTPDTDAAFQQRLATLATEGGVGSLQFLSDLSREQQAQFRRSWQSVPLEARQRVMRELV